MRPLRYLMILLAALMLLAPAALASGPSAGDQQYTDPLGGSNGGSNHTPSSGSSSNGSSSSAPAPPSSATASASPAATPIAPTPLSASTATTAQATASSLPRTGFNAWMGAAFGFVLLGAGFAVRRQVHRSLQ